MSSFQPAFKRLMWGSSRQAGRAQGSSQSASSTSSTTDNYGESNGTNVIPRENPINANVYYTQGNIVGVNDAKVSPPTNTTTQNNGSPTLGTTGIDVHVTPYENTKRDSYVAGITNCAYHSSSLSHLTDSK